MSLQVYNTLTRTKAPFVPIEAGRIRLYVCGVTTYDYVHIGHGRTFVAFDVIQRWLRASGWNVTYVRNITDIDDKIIRRAAEAGEPVGALTARFITAMHEDFAALGIQPPDHEPRATEFVPQMLGLIDLLEKKGLAYAADDGDVNFAVRLFPRYGQLANRSLDELRAGERVTRDSAKRDPLDFVLWKRAKPGEPQWDSRWGAGRPGWHIECSAMASELLGKHFDIHGGGPDLIFPHHENEIAQSEGANDERFANVWLHSGALRMGDDKMSKSLGNVLNIRDVVKTNHPESVRLFLLRTHYRSQMEFGTEQLRDADAELAGLYTALEKVVPDESSVDWSESHAKRFAEAMDDDFNMPVAVRVLHELATRVNSAKSPFLAGQLKRLGAVLGLLQESPRAFLQDPRRSVSIQLSGQEVQSTMGQLTPHSSMSPEEIQARIDLRTAAKKAKNYLEADRIRKELAELGVLLEDSANETKWRWR